MMKSSILRAACGAVILSLLGADVAWAQYLQPGVEADRIVVEKKNHTLTLFQGEKVLKAYKIALGQGGLGRKQQRGDNKTPEGLYTIAAHKHDSKYYLALKISYPEPRDVEAARKLKVDPGHNIMIHGLPDDRREMGPLHRQTDWTQGCIAMTNQEILEIWDAVPDGTPIEIKP